MVAPIHRLTKAEIVYLSTHHCPHGHTFLSHFSCYKGREERVGVLDLETSNLDADFGIVLTWCLKEVGKKEIASDVISKADIRKGKKGDEDRRVVRSCIKELLGFDKILTYYGKRFDVPYLRARAVHMGIDFPTFGTLKHIDVYDIIRHRFKMSRKRQELACRFLLGHTDKTHFDGVIWRNAARGDSDALAQVLDHNEKDVTDLEKLYNAVIYFSRKNDTSI